MANNQVGRERDWHQASFTLLGCVYNSIAMMDYGIYEKFGHDRRRATLSGTTQKGDNGDLSLAFELLVLVSSFQQKHGGCYC